MTAANHFDPTLRHEKELRQVIAADAKKTGVTVDAEKILPVLSQWVGWYRLESMPPYNATPREQHAEADSIIATIQRLNEQFASMSPNLRAHVNDKMRHLRLQVPEFARIIACVMAAKEELATPRNGEQPHKRPRNHAIRRVREAIADVAPALKDIDANNLAAELVGIELEVKVPSDAKELRRIVRG